MGALIVVENTERWRFDLPNTEIVSAKDYLLDSDFQARKGVTVFNLCRSFGYQSLGYYVSLLATARRHRPQPSVSTLQDLRSSPLIRITGEDLESLIRRSLRTLKADAFELSIYFGRNLAKRYDGLARAVFNQFPAPFLRADFVRKEHWRLERVRTIGTAEIPVAHEDFVKETAAQYFAAPRYPGRSGNTRRYDLALLVNPGEENPPSDEGALRRFERAARRMGLAPWRVDKDDYGHLAEYDALFIRETTAVNHHTYRFARRGVAEGLVVIDDPESIVRCTNKVYQAEVFARNGIATPPTLIVHRDNAKRVLEQIALPCVIKRPDSSFSQGVMKAASEAELETMLADVLRQSELAVVQAFMPSSFDWRIGVLGRRPLFACRYHMAKGHWQIMQKVGVRTRYGKVETLSVEAAPSRVVSLALRAANLIGDGFYGVDLKEVDGHQVVMEVNDNPSIESGVEDAVLKDELYLAVMRLFLQRMEHR